MREIWESIRPLEVALWIYRDEEWLMTARNRFVETEERIIQYRSTPISAETLLTKWEKEGKGPNDLLIIEEPRLVQKAYDRLKNRQDVDITHFSPDCLEMLPKGIHKGFPSAGSSWY